MRATLDQVIHVDVRPLAADDLAQLQKSLPPEHPEAHVRRLADQRAGRITYLVAWADGTAVGHVVIRWGGATNPELLWRLGRQDRHPYVEALLVHPAYRSQTIGTQLVEAAEWLVRARGHAQIGLAVATDNERASALYDRLGYGEAGIGQFANHWSYVDEAGAEVTATETCCYLVKALVGTIESSAAGSAD
jgi:ribosomal protein S18 acetylase RimI-like enzyme